MYPYILAIKIVLKKETYQSRLQEICIYINPIFLNNLQAGSHENKNYSLIMDFHH